MICYSLLDLETGIVLRIGEKTRNRYLEKAKNRVETDKKKTPNRELILKRDNYTCRLCGEKVEDISSLQVHHLTPISIGGNNGNHNLITICESCHLFMHCNPKLIIKQRMNHSLKTKNGMIAARNNGKQIGRPGGV